MLENSIILCMSLIFRVPPSQRSYVYCNAIKYGSEKEWEFLWQQFQKSDFSEERVDITDALSCSKNKTLLIRYENPLNRI